MASVDNTEKIKVWDRFVRIFHWSLVVAFTVAYLTEDDLLFLHVWAGYLVGLLILIRLAWGFVGSTHARFIDFIYRPTVVVQFMRDVIALRAKRYLGHNPAGGWMVVLLLCTLLLATITGIGAYAVEENAGPLAGIAFLHSGSEWFEEAHEIFSNLALVLVVVHIAGVLFESVLHRENLIAAMFTGLKRK